MQRNLYKKCRNKVRSSLRFCNFLKRGGHWGASYLFFSFASSDNLGSNVALGEAKGAPLGYRRQQLGQLGQGSKGQEQSHPSKDTSVDDSHRWAQKAPDEKKDGEEERNIHCFHHSPPLVVTRPRRHHHPAKECFPAMVCRCCHLQADCHPAKACCRPRKACCRRPKACCRRPKEQKA